MDLSIGEKKLESVRNPARIPPQTPPAGGNTAEAGRIQNPRKIVSPCRVRISSFNHLDFARNSFELCPISTAVNRNSNFRKKYGRREAPSIFLVQKRIFKFGGEGGIRTLDTVLTPYSGLANRRTRPSMRPLHF